MIAAACATLGAAGLALLFLASDRRLRLAGLLGLAAGEAGLAVWLVPASRFGAATRHPAAAAAALVVAVACVALGSRLCLRRPWLLAFAALIAAPVRIPIHLSGQEANLLLLLYGVIACAFVVIAVELWRGAAQPLLGREVGLPLAAFVGLYAISLAWSADTHRGAITVLFFLLPFGLLAAALVRLEPEPAQMRALGAVDVALAVAFSLVGLAQLATHHLFWNQTLIVSNLYSSFYRVNSVFYDPSVYGRFLAVALVVLVATLLLVRIAQTGRLIALVAVVALLWAGLVVSYSQSSYLALVVGLLACALLAWRWRAVAALAGALVLVAAAGLVAPQMRGFRHSIETGHLNRATSTRSGLIATGLRLFADHPLAGVGGGGFTQASRPKQNAEATAAKGASHDTPVTVLAELGLPGFAILCWLLFALGRTALRPPPGVPGRLRPYRLVIALALLVVFAHSLAYASFFEDPFTWALAALLVVCARPAPSTT
jgi:putative inorganic carbon (HCO3(-)) transporter